MEFNRRTLLKLGAVAAGEVFLGACAVNAEPTGKLDAKVATPITYPNKAPVPTPSVRLTPQTMTRDGLVPPTPNIAQIKPKPEVGVRLTREIKKGDLAILSYGNWIEFDGSIIVNKHPKLLITINGTNLLNLYNNESLHLKSNNKDRLALGLFAARNGQESGLALQSLIGELPTLLGQSPTTQGIDYLPLGIAVDQVVNDKRNLMPNGPVTNVYPDVERVMTVEWGIAMISLANETLPQDKKMRWSTELQYTLEAQPIFTILSIN